MAPVPAAQNNFTSTRLQLLSGPVQNEVISLGFPQEWLLLRLVDIVFPFIFWDKDSCPVENLAGRPPVTY